MKRSKAIILLVVFSCTLIGFNLQGHYCNGELTDISVLGKAKCEGECASHEVVHSDEQDHHEHAAKKCATKSDCKKRCETESEEDDCCSTESLSDLSDLEFAVELNYVQPIVLLSILLDYSIFEEEEEEAEVAWNRYIEPLPDKDRQVLHQSFLI